jgi:hypothetical protein
MIEEGLYDNDPNYVRATLYEKIFGTVPFGGYELQDGLVDRNKLLQWIKDNGFMLVHTKVSEFRDDGEERSVNYYTNEKTKVMIMLRFSYVDPSFLHNSNSMENSPAELESKKNPNKIGWFSFYAPSEEAILEIKKVINGIKLKELFKNKLYMLKSTEYGGLELEPFPIKIGKISLEMNYGKEFLDTHTKVVDNLKKKKSGLYIFHGPPGTGKTSYIKYLTTTVSTRKFIFVPNAMIADLFSPKLVDKLYTFKNSVLVLEDAEICVFKRNGANNELVSGILNVTDGLLKDLLNISIMVTFNSAEIDELDTALLRKGRLLVMHKFGLLSKIDSQTLATHLKKKKPVDARLSLADVYNLDESTGVEEVTPKPIGFGN